MAMGNQSVIFAFVGVALSLAGCGGGDDPSDGAEPQERTTTTTEEVLTTSLEPTEPTETTTTTEPTTTLPTTTKSTVPTTTTTTTTTTIFACPLYNRTHSCYDGHVVDLSNQFTCGANRNGDPAIFDWKTTACCAQGIPFPSKEKFCCFDGVHDNWAGECSRWADNFPTNCYCDGYLQSLNRSEVAVPEVAPNVIDTRVHPKQPCARASGNRGCLNGYLFDYTWQMPCGNYIVNVYTHGCCSTRGPDVSPYDLKKESCCKVSGGNHAVLWGPHACSCRKRDCWASEAVTV